MPGNGHIVDAPTIVDNGDPGHALRHRHPGRRASRQKELDLFDEKAELLADRLLAMPPFDEVADLINVHTVRTVSTDSGISRFPTREASEADLLRRHGTLRRMGLPRPELPRDPLARDHPGRGRARRSPGRRWSCSSSWSTSRRWPRAPLPRSQMVFTGLHTSDADLVNYTAHECCHAIASTAEEYLDGDGPTPGQTFLNQATEEQRLAGTVWWKSLAKASELKAAGDFKAVHLFGDPNVHFNKGKRRRRSSTRRRRSTESSASTGVARTSILRSPGAPDDAFTDPRGRNFYRAMANVQDAARRVPLLSRLLRPDPGPDPGGRDLNAA